MRQIFYFQNTTILLQNAAVITKCDVINANCHSTFSYSKYCISVYLGVTELCRFTKNYNLSKYISIYQGLQELQYVHLQLDLKRIST